MVAHHRSIHPPATDSNLRWTDPVPPRRTLTLHPPPRSHRSHRSLQRHPIIRSNVRSCMVRPRPLRPRRMGSQQPRCRIFVQQAGSKVISGTERTEDDSTGPSVGIGRTRIQLWWSNVRDTVVGTELLLPLWQRSFSDANRRIATNLPTIYAISINRNEKGPFRLSSPIFPMIHTHPIIIYLNHLS